MSYVHHVDKTQPDRLDPTKKTCIVENFLIHRVLWRLLEAVISNKVYSDPSNVKVTANRKTPDGAYPEGLLPAAFYREKGSETTTTALTFGCSDKRFASYLVYTTIRIQKVKIRRSVSSFKYPNPATLSQPGAVIGFGTVWKPAELKIVCTLEQYTRVNFETLPIIDGSI